ncbi:hypothetical protein [Burkholderia vietnamiensis]|uniref:hypothetical protein n=1 Tax=Burkholderia vietnamiensis TaxID=60552 RepID=UPI001CF39704|nr:hypothetical protein [Burkholderia vietnamiensis]MCA8197352.1 hypothetical protein [Burkholderia vietnamiensis]
MDRLMHFTGEIARAVSADFVGHGGRILGENGRELTPDDMASSAGVLGLLLWWAGDYARGHSLEFPFVTYEPSDDSLTGYRPREILLREMSGSMTLYMFSDFLRKELLVPERALEVDLSAAIVSFRSWCSLNVMSPGQRAKPRPGPGRAPE